MSRSHPYARPQLALSRESDRRWRGSRGEHGVDELSPIVFVFVCFAFVFFMADLNTIESTSYTSSTRSQANEVRAAPTPLLQKSRCGMS